ncbi:MAG: hypothetical protein ACP5SH_20695 [Syntrophobacteraceae bacterium]
MLSFIGTPAYRAHKEKRFPPADNKIIAQNEAFFLSEARTRSEYEKAYRTSRAIYYKDQPPFSDILKRIQMYAHQL